MGPGDPVIEACHILAYCKFPLIKLKPYITFLPPTWFVLTYIVRCKLWPSSCLSSCLLETRRRIDNQQHREEEDLCSCTQFGVNNGHSAVSLGTRRRIDNQYHGEEADSMHCYGRQNAYIVSNERQATIQTSVCINT